MLDRTPSTWDSRKFCKYWISTFITANTDRLAISRCICLFFLVKTIGTYQFLTLYERISYLLFSIMSFLKKLNCVWVSSKSKCISHYIFRFVTSEIFLYFRQCCDYCLNQEKLFIFFQFLLCLRSFKVKGCVFCSQFDWFESGGKRLSGVYCRRQKIQFRNSHRSNFIAGKLIADSKRWVLLV